VPHVEELARRPAGGRFSWQRALPGSQLAGRQ
jgi:hypothetical protein